MQDEERLRLVGGPYKAPQVEAGQVLRCSLRGPRVVHHWSTARIPWPCDISGSPILCGDLERAAREESPEALVLWCGATPLQAALWRGCVGAPRHRAEPRPAKPLTRRPNRAWSPEEDALLGTMLDRDVAAHLGRDVGMVGERRRALGITPFARQADRCALASVEASPAKVTARRLALGLKKVDVTRRAGFMSSTITRIENGERARMQRATLERLAAALECELGELLA